MLTPGHPGHPRPGRFGLLPCRERAGKSFHVSPYYFARFICDMPFRVGQGVLFGELPVHGGSGCCLTSPPAVPAMPCKARSCFLQSPRS